MNWCYEDFIFILYIFKMGFYYYILGVRCRRATGVIAKAVLPAVRAFGQRVVQGSPGPSRPLRLLPVRARRVADQYNHETSFSHESSSQDSDDSIKVGDQDNNHNYGNINNMVGPGGATAGDFNVGMPPITVQATITTTVNPIVQRPSRRFRDRFSHDYEDNSDYEYYDEIETPPTHRPYRRRSHSRRPRVRTSTTAATPTSPPIDSKTQLLQNLISQGLLDPKDLLESGYFSDSNETSIDLPVNRQRRSNTLEFENSEQKLIQYSRYIMAQKSNFWDEIIPLMAKYEIDFNIEVTIYSDPIEGMDAPTESLYASQLDNPFSQGLPSERERRSIDSDEPLESSDILVPSLISPNSTNVFEIRNVTHITHEKTLYHSSSTVSTHRISYETICICIFIAIVVAVLGRLRHSTNAN